MKSGFRNSRPATPVHGLTILALAAILSHVCLPASDLWVPGSGAPNLEKSRCVYQVFQDKRCLGTVFLKESADLPSVLRELGVNSRAEWKADSKMIPCDCRVVLSPQPPGVSLESMAGASLLCAGRRIDVNVASPKDLLAVPGIGPRLAAQIVETRQSQGPFSCLNDLQRVRGIARKKLAGFSPFLKAGPITRCRPAAAHPVRVASP